MNVKEWPTVLCFLASGVIIAVIYPRLPLSVPVHWGIDGTPDRFGSRFEALFTVPLTMLSVIAPLWIIERFSPSDRANAAIFRTVRLGLGAFTLLLTLAQALEWNLGRAALIGTGLLLALLGNVLGRAQPSVFVGLRTPWVFLSRRAWFASQRRTALWFTGLGVMLMGVSALLPLNVLFPWVAPVGLLLSTGGMVAWLIYASYRDCKEDPTPEPVFKP